METTRERQTIIQSGAPANTAVAFAGAESDCANPASAAARFVADSAASAARIDLGQEPVRVLVVDDNPTVLRVLVAVLQQHESVTVVGTAMDGSSGLSAASVLRPDLVVMDVSMPVMHGLEAASRLRSLYPSTKILMTSADDDSDLQQACLDAGADAFAPKAEFGQKLPACLASLFSRYDFFLKA